MWNLGYNSNVRQLATKAYLFISLAGVNVGSALANIDGNVPTGGNGDGKNTDTATDTAVAITNPLRFDDVGSLIKAVGGFLFGLASALLTVMILWGAFQLMTSGGNADRIKTGRSTITWAAIGFAVVLVAGGVGSLVADILGGPSADIEEVIDSPITGFDSALAAVNTIATWMFAILMALGVIMILVAAFQYLFSQGDETKITQARNALVAAIAAMVIGVLAGGVSVLIQNALGV